MAISTTNWKTTYSTYPYLSGIKFDNGGMTVEKEKPYKKDLSSFNNTEGGRYFILDLKDRYTYPENFRTYAEACSFAEAELRDDACAQRFAVCYIDAVAEGKLNGFTVDVRADLE